MQLKADGAEKVEAALNSDQVQKLKAALAPFDRGNPGVRIADLQPIAFWISRGGCIHEIASKVLGPASTAVRAVLFDKSPESNWALTWHQDRTIAVRRKADVPGFGPWTIKHGIVHVEPPFSFIERMLTVRVHLDQVPAENAPLLVSPGTHRLGKITESRLDQVVAEHGSRECLAEAGDVWIYQSSILHASARSAGRSRRRALQVDYSADRLPEPLRWQLSRYELSPRR